MRKQRIDIECNYCGHADSFIIGYNHELVFSDVAPDGYVVDSHRCAICRSCYWELCPDGVVFIVEEISEE